MTECQACGAQLKAGAKFCPSCGTEVPPPARFCAACGHEIEPGTSFCADCGAAVSESQTGATKTEVRPTPETMPAAEQTASQVTAPMAPLASEVPPSPPPLAPPVAAQPSEGGGRFSPRLLWLAIAVGVLAVAAAIVVVVFVAGHSTAKTSSKPLVQQVDELLAPVRTAQLTLRTDLRRPSATQQFFTLITSDGRQLASAIQTAQSIAAGLSSKKSDESTMLADLKTALSDHAAYASDVAKLGPDPQSFGVTDGSDISTKARNAETAYATLVHSMSSGLQPMTMAARDTDTWPALATSVAQRAALTDFCTRMANLVREAGQGRSDIIHTVASVMDQSMAPDEAATVVQNVIDNRQTVVTELAALTVPNDPSAKRAYDDFQGAVEMSLESDRAYKVWMQTVYNYYYQPPMGYMGHTPTDANYREAQSRGNTAGALKSKFVAVFNSLCRRLGLPHNWNTLDL